jgi:hypothetical protein
MRARSNGTRKKASKASSSFPAPDFSAGVRGKYVSLFDADYEITVHYRTFSEVFIVRRQPPCFPLKDRRNWARKGHLEAA